MNKFLERLQSGEILIADGSTGASLQKMGLKPGTPPEELVFDAPDMVLQLEGAFVAAGSDIILTDTFGGTRLRMRESKYGERAPEINRRAAELARQAAARGSAIEAYAADLLEVAVNPPAAADEPQAPPPARDVLDAIERLKVFGKTRGLSLGGMTIRELRHEARP